MKTINIYIYIYIIATGGGVMDLPATDAARGGVVDEGRFNQLKAEHMLGEGATQDSVNNVLFHHCHVKQVVENILVPLVALPGRRAKPIDLIARHPLYPYCSQGWLGAFSGLYHGSLGAAQPHLGREWSKACSLPIHPGHG